MFQGNIRTIRALHFRTKHIHASMNVQQRFFVSLHSFRLPPVHFHRRTSCISRFGRVNAAVERRSTPYRAFVDNFMARRTTKPRTMPMHGCDKIRPVLSP